MAEALHQTTDHRRDALKATLRSRAASFVGTVAFLHGTAEVHDPLTTQPRSLDAGVRLATGTRVVVKSGRMLVRLDDGSDVWLAAGAALDLTQWRGKLRELELAAGRMLAFIAPDRSRPFRTATPSGLIEVTGTAFEASASAQELEVGVLHGSVIVRNDLGEVRLRRGRGAIATRRQAPTASSYRPDRAHFQWLGDLSPTAANPSVRSAFAASRKLTGLPADGGAPHTHSDRNTPMKRMLIVGTLIAVVGVTAALALRKDKTPETGTVPKHLQAMQGTDGSNAAGNPKVLTESKIRIKLADGTEMEVDPSDPKAMKEFMAKLPEDMRKNVQFSATRDGGKGASATWSGDAPAGSVNLTQSREAIDRNAQSAADMMRALIDSGISPEEAAQLVSASLSDSITKQLRAENSDANVQVKVLTGEDVPEGLVMIGEDGKPRTPATGAVLMIMREDGKEIDLPKKGS